MFEGRTVEQAGPVDCLLPLDWLEVVPQDLALDSLVRHTAAVGDGVCSVLHGCCSPPGNWCDANGQFGGEVVNGSA